MLTGMTCVDVLRFTLFKTLMVLTNSRNSVHRWLISTSLLPYQIRQGSFGSDH